MIFKKKPKVAITPAPAVTVANFQKEVVETDKIVLLDFWAPWCGPCKVMGPIIDELSSEFGDKAVIAKVNVDQEPQLSGQFQVRSIPSLFFVKDGKIVEMYRGVVPKPNLEEILKDYIAGTREIID